MAEDEKQPKRSYWSSPEKKAPSGGQPSSTNRRSRWGGAPAPGQTGGGHHLGLYVGPKKTKAQLAKEERERKKRQEKFKKEAAKREKERKKRDKEIKKAKAIFLRHNVRPTVPRVGPIVGWGSDIPLELKPKNPVIRHRSPQIRIKAQALQDMDLLIHLVEKEVGWISHVTREGDVYIIENVMLVGQHSQGALFDFHDDGQHTWMTEMDYMEHPERLDHRCMGHSHVDMDTGASGRDNSMIAEYLADEDCDWYIQLIANKRGKKTFTLWIRDEDKRYFDVPWSVVYPESEERRKHWEEQISAKVEPYPHEVERVPVGGGDEEAGVEVVMEMSSLALRTDFYDERFGQGGYRRYDAQQTHVVAGAELPVGLAGQGKKPDPRAVLNRIVRPGDDPLAELGVTPTGFTPPGYGAGSGYGPGNYGGFGSGLGGGVEPPPEPGRSGALAGDKPSAPASGGMNLLPDSTPSRSSEEDEPSTPTSGENDGASTSSGS